MLGFKLKCIPFTKWTFQTFFGLEKETKWKGKIFTFQCFVNPQSWMNKFRLSKTSIYMDRKSYIYTIIHVLICTCIHRHMYSYTHKYTYKHIHSLHVCTHTHYHLHTHTYRHTHSSTPFHACIHIQAYSYWHTHSQIIHITLLLNLILAKTLVFLIWFPNVSISTSSSTFCFGSNELTCDKNCWCQFK